MSPVKQIAYKLNSSLNILSSS